MGAAEPSGLAAVASARGKTEHEFQGAALRAVVGGALAVSVGFSSLVIFSFAVFLKPVTDAFGWGRGEASMAFSITAMTVALVSPVLGRLVDRFGARRVALVCTTCFVAFLLSLTLLRGSLWHWFGAYFLMGLVGNGTTQLPYAKVICGWYERQRGLALALMMLGVGVSAVAIPLLTERLLASFGIQGTFGTLAAMAAAIALPSLLLLVRENPRPGESGRLSRSEGSDNRANYPTEKPAVATSGGPLRILLPFASFFLVSIAVNGSMAHLSAMVTDRGFSAAQGAILLSAMGAMVLAGRVIAGWLLDRYRATLVAAGLFGASVLGLGLLLAGDELAVLGLGASLVGLAMGAEADIVPYLVSRMFPLRRFTEMYGYAFAAFAFGGAIGPALMGAGFDRFGNYQTALAGMIVCASIASIMVAFARVPGRETLAVPAVK